MTLLQFDNPFSTDRLNAVDDFRPEWDVPALGKAFTDAFSTAIGDVRSHPEPKPERKIHAFLGQAGYGKTHLFGRIVHQQADRCYFAFIPAFSATDEGDKQKQLEATIRWRLVESLLHSTHYCSPLQMQMAWLLDSSFTAYFDKLSSGLKAKCATLREELDTDPLVVLKVLSHVTELGPYHQLADAIGEKFPRVSQSVIRGLVLAISPAAEGDARRWLRGEADQISEERRKELRLSADSPSLNEILRTVAEVLNKNEVALVICFDQLEELFKNNRLGFTALTGQLMSWLQTMPNLLIGIGCFRDTWKELRGEAGFKAFLDRAITHDLPPLSGSEAVEVIKRRMRSWTDFDTKQESGWPFDLNSVRAYGDREHPSPRSFIQGECAPRFTEWQAKKREGLIRFDSGPIVSPITELFRQEWDKELKAIQSNRIFAANLEASELWGGVEEAITVAKLGAYQSEGFRLDSIDHQPIAKSPTDPRPSARLNFTGNGRTASVIVAVSTKDGGVAFGAWYNALAAAMNDSVVGAVVAWPRSELSVGKTSAGFKSYDGKLKAGTIRHFPLDKEHEATFQQMECLRRVIQRAGTDLILNGRVVPKDECRKLIVDTGLLSNLKLFEFAFQNWKGPTAGASIPSAAAVAPTPPLLTTVTPVATPAPPPAIDPTSTTEPTWAEKMLKKTADYLKKRGQEVHAIGADVGPTFVRLKVELRGDADFGKIKRQEKNLKVNLLLADDPLIQAQAGYVSIDVQRPDRQTVALSPLLPSCPVKFAGEPAFPVGVGVGGNTEWLNLSEPESCHVLVAGTTGSGKSEFLKAVLAALAARLEPSQIRFRLIDPKRVTFNVDSRCPYLGGPVVYNGEEVIPVLEECSEEMERRYELLQRRSLDHVRQLGGADAVPRWVVVMDEFANLMTDKATKKQLEPLLQRLGAKARAAGIHLVLGTQRPEASVVTPLLRANLPGRIGLQVASEKESKLFLDEPDAAYLFGKGDLVWKRGGGLTRLQSPFVEKREFESFLRGG